MPAAWKNCVKDRIKEGKSEDEAYAICTAWFKEKFGTTPQEWHKKHYSKGSYVYDLDANKHVWMQFSMSEEDEVVEYNGELFDSSVFAVARIDMPSDVGKYIRLRLENPNLFSRFRVKWLDKVNGIRVIYGVLKKTGKVVMQSVMFVKEKWDKKSAKEWVKNHFGKTIKGSVIDSAMASIIIEPDINIVHFVTAAHVGGPEVFANVGFPAENDFISASVTSAGIEENISDLMYITFSLAHVGINKNKDEFLENEIRSSVSTPIHKLLNWQHGEPNIGCITNSMVIEDSEKEPIHIAVAGAISCRKYPVYAEEIKNRYINKNLFTSMEAYFKTAKCNICGGEYESMYDYCDHLRGIKFGSPKYPTASRQLIGLCFAGAAVAVDEPADELSIVSNIKV